MRVVTILLELNDKLSVGRASRLFSHLFRLDKVEFVDVIATYAGLAEDREQCGQVAARINRTLIPVPFLAMRLFHDNARIATFE